MPLDLQAQKLLDMAAGAPPMHTLPVPQARAAMTAALSTKGEPEPVYKVENKTIPWPVRDIPVRVYTPTGTGPFPILLYFHGGGWVVNNLETHDSVCRFLTNAAECVVV